LNSRHLQAPVNLTFDVAVAAIGYEQRSSHIAQHFGISAKVQLGFKFGFLEEGSFQENLSFFEGRMWRVLSAQDADSFSAITKALTCNERGPKAIRLFVDVSSMSREMMANIALAIEAARSSIDIELTIAYAAAEFSGSYLPAPIRLAAPVLPRLAGWSSRPDVPLGVVMGLGCEPGLALGALQVLEPTKSWLYAPRGFDQRFEKEIERANASVADIFDVAEFEYEIYEPEVTHGRLEALLNSISPSFRLICVPFGPKLFSWIVFSSVIFSGRRQIGIWSFSSKEQGEAIDRKASGETVWYTYSLAQPAIETS
jgi:hypothetical protein